MEVELERLRVQTEMLKHEKARAVAERDEAENALHSLQSEHQTLRDLYRKQLEQFSNEKQLTNEASLSLSSCKVVEHLSMKVEMLGL